MTWLLVILVVAAIVGIDGYLGLGTSNELWATYYKTI